MKHRPGPPSWILAFGIQMICESGRWLWPETVNPILVCVGSFAMFCWAYRGNEWLRDHMEGEKI